VTHMVFFNLSQQIVLYELLNQIEIVAAIIGIITGILGLIIFIDWIRPKVKNTRIVATYLDYETDKLVEEKEMEITWAFFSFFRAITLRRIPREAKYELDFRSSSKPRTRIAPGNYTVLEAGKFRKIRLLRKEFCKEDDDVDYIFLTLKTLQNEEYRKHIHEEREKNKIVLQNDNLTEVRNYKVEFLQKMTMDRALPYFAIAERIITSESASGEATITALILKPIQPSQRIEIPL